MPNTENFNWTLPTPGGDLGQWDEILNAAFEAADASLKAVKDTAEAALPKSGGTLTGALHTKTESTTLVQQSNASGTVTLNLAAANVFVLTLTGNVTSLVLTNVPASPKFTVLLLEIINSGGKRITWPSSFKFPGGAAPSLTATGTDVFAFYTRDGGSNWLFVGAQQGL